MKFDGAYRWQANTEETSKVSQTASHWRPDRRLIPFRRFWSSESFCDRTWNLRCERERRFSTFEFEWRWNRQIRSGCWCDDFWRSQRAVGGDILSSSDIDALLVTFRRLEHVMSGNVLSEATKGQEESRMFWRPTWELRYPLVSARNMRSFADLVLCILKNKVLISGRC